MTNVSFYDSIRFSFIASDGERGITREKLAELGVQYSEKKLDKRSSEFTIEGDLNRVFIGLLHSLFN